MSAVICPGCGAENPNGKEFCRQCARRLDVATADRIADQRSTALANPQTDTRWMAIVIAIVVIAALAVVLAVLVIR